MTVDWLSRRVSMPVEVAVVLVDGSVNSGSHVSMMFGDGSVDSGLAATSCADVGGGVAGGGGCAYCSVGGSEQPSQRFGALHDSIDTSG